VALNRTPGYHFCGNFFNLLFDDVDNQHSIVHMDAAVQCADQDGQSASRSGVNYARQVRSSAKTIGRLCCRVNAVYSRIVCGCQRSEGD
jgi:hypothetical protein